MEITSWIDKIEQIKELKERKMKMTVKELKERLAEFPDDMKVVVSTEPNGNYYNFLADIDEDLMFFDNEVVLTATEGK